MYKLQLLTFFTFANHFNILWIYLSWSPSLILSHEYRIQLYKIVTYLYFLNLVFYGWEFSIWRCILYHVLFFFEAWLAFEAYYICLLPETACNRFITESYVCPEKLLEAEVFWLAHEFRTTASWIRRMSLPWPALHIAVWLWQRWRHFLYNGGRNITIYYISLTMSLYWIFKITIL